MKLKDSINKFYFDMNINELKLYNSKPIIPDITYNSLLYLNIIAYQENCTVSFIASAINVSKSAVTIKINELIKQGLVIKTTSETDKRVNYLTASDLFDDVFALYDRAIFESIKQIEATYSKEEIAKFCDMMNILNSDFAQSIN